MSRKSRTHQVDIDGVVRYIVEESKMGELETWLDKNAVGGQNVKAELDIDEEIVIDLEPTNGVSLPIEGAIAAKEKRTKK